jgi:hypothetical protein
MQKSQAKSPALSDPRNFGSLGPAHEGQSDCCSQQEMGSALVSDIAESRTVVTACRIEAVPMHSSVSPGGQQPPGGSAGSEIGRLDRPRPGRPRSRRCVGADGIAGADRGKPRSATRELVDGSRRPPDSMTPPRRATPTGETLSATPSPGCPSWVGDASVTAAHLLAMTGGRNRHVACDRHGLRRPW